MWSKFWPSLGAVLLIAAGASAQAPPSAPPTSAPPAASPQQESAQQNVKESEQYEKLLCSNPAFRKTRIEKECGPIDDPQLHQQCVDSFQCGAHTPVHPRQTPTSER
jgi:hypothetical protein